MIIVSSAWLQPRWPLSG